ncbi:MAG: hypothetical protein WBI40_00260 [Methylococcaceae bacterium]
MLPHVLIGQESYKTNLSSAQQALVGNSKEKDVDIKLEDPTISELCILLRCKKISTKFFIANWQEALLRSDNSQIAMDLLSLLRTNAKLKDNFIHLSNLSHEHKAHLAKIAKNWKLSPRLLIILVREGIITAKEIQEDSGRIEDIVLRMSPMNAYRFLKSGIIKRSDIPDVRFRELLEGMEKEKKDSKLISGLQQLGLLSTKNVVSLRRNKKYSVSDLINENLRMQINGELKFKQWDVTVTKLSDYYGFLKHPNFSENIVFWLDKIENPHSKTLTEGDILRVGIKTQFNKKKEQWGFAVISGSILKKYSE